MDQDGSIEAAVEQQEAPKERGPVVELNNVFLKTDRGDQIFRDLSLRLMPGRSAVITGPAGSGKSLLVEILIGARFADSGSVELFGHVLRRGKTGLIKKVRRRIGGVGGMFSLIPSYTVAENITFPLILAGEKKRFRKERLMKMLTEFSLLKQAGEYPKSLTRVENMLVQFARASIANQPLMIIDEPAAGLDSKTYKRVLDYLIKVAVSGRSMIIVTSERPKEDLPQTDYYQIVNRRLA
jgi:ABC-type ATPase involved in cell division